MRIVLLLRGVNVGGRNKVTMGVVRSTYIIDEQGVIERVMPKVKPDTNAADIIAYLG